MRLHIVDLANVIVDGGKKPVTVGSGRRRLHNRKAGLRYTLALEQICCSCVLGPTMRLECTRIECHNP
jgi:hypothetical protein